LQPGSSNPVEPLILDLLEWIKSGTRTHADVMEVWRTSCPRLPVWEDACERGFVEPRHAEGGGTVVVLTPLGRDFLAERRPPRPTR
jgi:hypothetical protein